jgi:nitrite reductase (NO-forming)
MSPTPTSRRPGRDISRRHLLAGSAGLTAASVMAPTALAQTSHLDGGRVYGAAHEMGTLSNRIYSVNPTTPEIADIAENPANVPPPVGRTEPATVRVELETREIEAHLDYNTKFQFWTFNGTVPGPMVRARVGDTIEVTLRNHESSSFAHNVDFHACTGPGGGAELSTVMPGEERRFRFKALNSGLYVYHCAVPPVAQHISRGMYGMILIEPEEGLPPVDREYYVMQGEIYTEEPAGTAGLLNESFDRLIDERPTYFVFNGHVGALTDHYPLAAKVGETVRIFNGRGRAKCDLILPRDRGDL